MIAIARAKYDQPHARVTELTAESDANRPEDQKRQDLIMVMSGNVPLR